MQMMILNVLALACVALFWAGNGVVPADALSTARYHHLNRGIIHDTLLKNEARGITSKTRRCRQRPSNSTSASGTSGGASSAHLSYSPAPAPVKTSSQAVPVKTSSQAAPVKTSSQAAPVVSISVSVGAGPATPPKTPSATPSPSHAPAPAPPPSSGGGAGKKVGLAWPNGETSDLLHYATASVGWIYSWSPWNPDPNHKAGLEFMPMLWGPKQIDDFEKQVKAGYASYLLGFNEPNEKGQSNLDPGYAAQLWKDHIEPKRKLGYQTCSPATSSNPNGFTWMDNFFKACGGGCTVDFICVHWYDVKAADFKTYVEKWHSIYEKDIFITEFAPQNFNGGGQPSSGDVWAFYQEVMPWIQQTSYIKAAFPFGFMHDMSGVNLADQLMASTGQPTDLGWFIINGKY